MASALHPSVPAETLASLFNNTGVQYELVDGALCAKPMGSVLHGMMISWLSYLLEAQIDDDHISVTDPHSKLDDRNWLRPDLALLKVADADNWKYIQPGRWPQFCIEIQSPPDQTTGELLDKCRIFHQQGVAYCWVIDPESRNAWEYHKGQQPKWIGPSETLKAGVIQIPANELWKALKRRPKSSTLPLDR